MLVLSRKSGESIRINDNITIKVVSVGPGRVKIAIDAPQDVTILRGELVNDQPDCVLSAVPVGGVAAV